MALPSSWDEKTSRDLKAQGEAGGGAAWGESQHQKGEVRLPQDWGWGEPSLNRPPRQ